MCGKFNIGVFQHIVKVAHIKKGPYQNSLNVLYQPLARPENN